MHARFLYYFISSGFGVGFGLRFSLSLIFNALAPVLTIPAIHGTVDYRGFHYLDRVPGAGRHHTPKVARRRVQLIAGGHCAVVVAEDGIQSALQYYHALVAPRVSVHRHLGPWQQRIKHPL